MGAAGAPRGWMSRLIKLFVCNDLKRNGNARAFGAVRANYSRFAKDNGVLPRSISTSTDLNAGVFERGSIVFGTNALASGKYMRTLPARMSHSRTRTFESAPT